MLQVQMVEETRMQNNECKTMNKHCFTECDGMAWNEMQMYSDNNVKSLRARRTRSTIECRGTPNYAKCTVHGTTMNAKWTTRETHALPTNANWSLDDGTMAWAWPGQLVKDPRYKQKSRKTVNMRWRKFITTMSPRTTWMKWRTREE